MPVKFNKKLYVELKQEAVNNVNVQTSPNEKFMILPKALPSLPKPTPLGVNQFTDMPKTDQMIGLERSKKRPTGRGFIAVVIDSGVFNHSAFDGAIIKRLSAVKHPTKPGRYSNDITDQFGHGTHMAGIIASREEHNGMGIAPGAKIISIKVSDPFGGNATWSSIYNALLRVIAIANGTDKEVGKIKERIGVVNLSFNGIDNLPPSGSRDHHKIIDAIITLETMKIPVVVSAGNAYKHFLKYGLGYPAYNNTTINVGAQFNYDFPGFRLGSIATFSQRISSASIKKADKTIIMKNPKRFLVAPGACSVSLGLASSGSHKFSMMSGSSCSAAIVSACILILQQAGQAHYPEGIPVNELIKLLVVECDPDLNVIGAPNPEYKKYFDNNLYPGINIHKALDQILHPVII